MALPAPIAVPGWHWEGWAAPRPRQVTTRTPVPPMSLCSHQWFPTRMSTPPGPLHPSRRAAVSYGAGHCARHSAGGMGHGCPHPALWYTHKACLRQAPWSHRATPGLGGYVPCKCNVSNDLCQQEGGHHPRNPSALGRCWQKDLRAGMAKPGEAAGTVMPAAWVPPANPATLGITGLQVSLPTRVPQCHGPWA